MQKKGLVLELDLVALQQRTNGKRKMENKEKNSMHILESGKAVRGIVSTCRVYQRNRTSCRKNENDAQRCRKDRHTITCVVETLANPTKDGTRSQNTATLYSLQKWCEMH